MDYSFDFNTPVSSGGAAPMSQHSSPRLIFILLLILVGCADSLFRNVGRSQEVEIAPSEWLKVRMVHTVYDADLKDPHRLSPTDLKDQTVLPSTQEAGRIIDMEETHLVFDWDGKRVDWRGREIPISIRKHDGRLYMIGFNREELFYQITRLVFFEMNQDRTGFQEMHSSDYPRKIATQNMWLSAANRYFRANEGIKDNWDLVRNLKVDDRFFGKTYTAQIWYQIETGTRHSDMPGTIPQTFTRAYVEKYKPIPLPTVVRER